MSSYLEFAARGSQTAGGLASNQTVDLHPRELREFTLAVTSQQPRLSDQTLRASTRVLCPAGGTAGDLCPGRDAAANHAPCCAFLREPGWRLVRARLALPHG